MPNIGGAPDEPGLSRSATTAFDPVFSQQRVSYEAGELIEDELADSPLRQFRRWYDDALAAGILEPNAMTLATVDPAGLPSARVVLLKHADALGFTFFTNYESRKGTQLAGNPAAALVFAWIPLRRQVCVRGRTERVPAEETAAYFGTRPWDSRIGAWASRQSRPLASRAELERRWAQLAERWPDTGRPDDVPVPAHWGGYVVRPVEVEFWQGRASRLHDRLVFLPEGEATSTPALDDAGAWRVERRQP